MPCFNVGVIRCALSPMYSSPCCSAGGSRSLSKSAAMRDQLDALIHRVINKPLLRPPKGS